MDEPDWKAEPTQYGDCWYIWIHGGEITDDGAVVSFFHPKTSYVTIPQKLVMMPVSAFAELAHFAEVGRRAALTQDSRKEGAG